MRGIVDNISSIPQILNIKNNAQSIKFAYAHNQLFTHWPNATLKSVKLT